MPTNEQKEPLDIIICCELVYVTAVIQHFTCQVIAGNNSTKISKCSQRICKIVGCNPNKKQIVYFIKTNEIVK